MFFAKKRDYMLVIALLLLCFVILLIEYISNRQDDACAAVIEKNGTVLYEIPLSEIREPAEISVDGEIPVRILLESDGAQIIYSTCPDQLCVKNGKLKKAGQCSVCLPARVSLKLKGNGKDNADAMTG